MRTYKILITIILTASLNFAQNDISLPSIISDNMVLQQKSNAPLWGRGIPGSDIKLVASWGEEVSGIVKEDSLWLLNINTPNAGGPFSIKILNLNNTITLNNIMVGEVWLCSGQSNMEMPLFGWPPNDLISNSKMEIENSLNKNIRFFTVTKDISVEPKMNCVGAWVHSEPGTSTTFSATAYFFGKKLYEELKIPIGLIHSSWGGTPAESWTNKKYLSQFTEFDSTLKYLDVSLPASRELSKWLEKFPQIDISTKSDGYILSDLDLDDSECSLPEYDDTEWNVMNLPTLWEQAELGEFDGVVWFRKKIELPENWLNRALTLELGPIDDFDITYVNGKKVGSYEEDGNYQTKRIYNISAELNNSKTLSISVKVNDTRGGGGIYGDKDEMKIVKIEDGTDISISGEWSYLPVAEFKGTNYSVFGAKNNGFNSRPKLPISLSSNTPTVLYNAMIAPLVPFKFRGAIWYQGESNTGNPLLYERLFPSMINNWREDFGHDFPFYYVQIAPYNYGKSTYSGFLRDAQRKTLFLNNTGMAVTLDIGDTNNIHPANKKDVGERLAFWALAKQYEKDIKYSGPIYKSIRIIGNKIEIEFINSEDGLEIKEGLSQFIIAGADKKFTSAKAKIENNKLIVWAESVKNPFAVRYAWHNNATATLFNSSGLPASSFRTDNWFE